MIKRDMNTDLTDIQKDLFAMRDGSYACFQSKLIPTLPAERFIGVRTPMLRKYAKKIANTEAAAGFLRELPHRYYDENNLHAALLENIRDFNRALEEVNRFLPYIDNWATCDGFCPRVLRKDPDRLWTEIQKWLAASQEYTVRYGLVRLTSWFMDAPLFSPAVLQAAANIQSDTYYVQMAQAWLFSVALAKQFEATLPYVTEQVLPTWVHNKAIQKACESYRVPSERKKLLRSLKAGGRNAEDIPI